jgi:8-oxo-dGTP pyrophosphatase MutT (NUDIX family)
VVLDGQGRVLLIERDVRRGERTIHEVRLPKGHVDEGESDLEAALRETREETGYCDLDVIADIGEGRSEYDHKGKHYVRNEHYFLLRLRTATHRAPDVDPASEEALFRPSWAASLGDAKRRLTYTTEQEFAGRALAWTERSQEARQ